ncbi:DegT/DnrJ/EryC1/StrS family aminotransferase [Dethiosulfovibrio salsuginis]|uniref:dTDP-4-amino-4,6-dideoxygalactose transaminase n=1 Tax=Dethiosulfovibrio salsuginis TaxID=561720 RepID=A0A1X7KGB6_9BACT|nr:DegT/DnrJ/EryC1/StrS aminotransferase family protein [Dethiosulfovibrio salsuginis]SMG39962.1 dTDP-4-amino-4,6-dideoxygalactose transaminase [Dethiosulfovibrio salsuginis]
MRDSFLPFARPEVDEESIEDLCQSIRSGWLTTGPKTQAFEEDFSKTVGATYSISVSSATAGLHLAFLGLGIEPGDEVITTPMTFVATVNAAIWAGATPVLVDIDPKTLNIDVEQLEGAITDRTKAIVPVHFAGLPCDMDRIEAMAEKHGLAIVEDAAHALGASYRGRPIGADRGPRRCSVFSFHPTKNITTGEGGMVCTSDEDLAERISVLRQHGMSKGAWNRYAAKGNPHYDVLFPGFKANMMDIQAAIGRGQLKKLDSFNSRRKTIVDRYREAFKDQPGLTLPGTPAYDHVHSWHIFTPLVDVDKLDIDRDGFMGAMRELNLGTALHYQALHLFSYYQETYRWRKGDFPNAEMVSDRIVSLPLFPAMTDFDVEDVINGVRSVMESHL